MSFKNLVLAGAQLKGFAYIGVYRALVDTGLINDIYNVCGVSSGSIVSLFICMELNTEVCENIIYKIVKIHNLKTFKSSEIFNIGDTYGLETGDNIKKILYYLIDKQTGNRHCTFKELKERFPSKNLIILVTNITTGKEEYLSVDTTPDMELYTAIRASISIPFIFTKVEYNDLLYGDGGLINNLPVDYFKDDIENTVGCCVSFLGDYTDILSLTAYASRIFNIVSNVKQNMIMNIYKENIINVIIPHTSIIDSFNETEHKKTFIQAGYNQFLKNIKKLPIYKNISHRFIIKDILDEIIEKINN